MKTATERLSMEQIYHIRWNIELARLAALAAHAAWKAAWNLQPMHADAAHYEDIKVITNNLYETYEILVKIWHERWTDFNINTD